MCGCEGRHLFVTAQSARGCWAVESLRERVRRKQGPTSNHKRGVV